MQRIIIICLILCCYCVPGAYALTVNVADNIPDHVFLSAGSVLNGSFDISSAIPKNGQYISPYKVSGATAKFQFVDNLDSLSSTTPVFSDYTKYYDYDGYKYFVRYKTQWNVNPQEQVQLSLVGQVSEDGTTWYEMPLTDVGNQTLDKITGGGKNYFYTQVQQGEHGYNGTVTLIEALGAAGLADLSSDGTVPFTLKMLQGDMFYESGLLTADVDANPAGAPPVPEPGTVLLVGIGLLGVVVRVRYRKSA